MYNITPNQPDTKTWKPYYAISSLVPLKLLDENNTLSIKLNTAYGSNYILYAEKILIEILKLRGNASTVVSS